MQDIDVLPVLLVDGDPLEWFSYWWIDNTGKARIEESERKTIHVEGALPDFIEVEEYPITDYPRNGYIHRPLRKDDTVVLAAERILVESITDPFEIVVEKFATAKIVSIDAEYNFSDEDGQNSWIVVVTDIKELDET